MNTIQVSDRTRELLAGSIVCDLCLPWGPANENKEPTLPRFADSGFTYISLTVGMDWVTLEDTVRHIGAERKRFLSEPDKYVLVEKVEDILRAKSENKLALSFHFQGTNPLAKDLNMVEVYHKLGIRRMLLAYNEKNSVADGCHERTDCGLSRFGVSLIQAMNRVGIIVDCTHTGYRSSMEAIELSTAPVIFSHSVARGLKDHDRNIRDDQIKASAKTGGVIGLNGVGFFLGDNDASPEMVARHVDYICNLVGPEHVAFGFDYVYYMDSMIARYRANPNRYPEGYPEPPWHFVAPEDLPALVELLVRRGYADKDIKGFLGENYLRVARTVWAGQ